MEQKKQRRRNGKIDRLEPDLKDTVDQMLLSGATYREVVEYLQEHDVQLSRTAVCTYAKKFLATAQMLRIAHDNFKMLMDDIDRRPDLDATEGIIRIMGNSILNTLANATPEDWQSVNMERMLREANSLVRVTAHKKRVDMQNRSAMEKALIYNRGTLFDILSERHPELYRQLEQVIKQLQDEANEEHQLNGV